MRFTYILAATHSPGKGRCPQPPNKTPFQEILPLRLKDRVSGKSDKKAEGSCLQEMIIVLSCLQKNEYENKLCQKEVDQFKSCFQKFQDVSFQSKRAKEKGILVPGDKNLTHKQVKKLFNMRPML
ncbi:hypothetical protein TSAR_000894 [Trichomalopsis sarcophagae]|uniref:CHCH domain-containing protein n=1 Tax=Trichomalopsis sarcophagae TaxID=543379 RepID=A0A232F7E2_9HYME|nr:hypothetical protein TSAR_000894 [Trichomalopsis sarcophagae]